MRSRHARLVFAAPEGAFAAALDAGADPVAALLLRARRLRPEPSLERFFSAHGFETLERTATSLVVGASGRPWRLREPLRPFPDAAPGTVQVVASIAAEPPPRDVASRGRCLLSTETRVLATDARARRAFRAYWFLVGPFSSLIRRRWLAAGARAR